VLTLPELEEEFKDMKACQNFIDTESVFPLLQSLRVMKTNQECKPDDLKTVKSHDNKSLITAFIAATRIAEEHNRIPKMSPEFENLQNFGESVVSEILKKRNIGDAGRYGYQQVKYRSIFITQADKEIFLAAKNTMTYPRLKRSLETELAQLQNSDPEAAAAIKRTVQQIELSEVSPAIKRELLYRGGG